MPLRRRLCCVATHTQKGHPVMEHVTSFFTLCMCRLRMFLDIIFSMRTVPPDPFRDGAAETDFSFLLSYIPYIRVIGRGRHFGSSVTYFLVFRLTGN